MISRMKSGASKLFNEIVAFTTAGCQIGGPYAASKTQMLIILTNPRWQLKEEWIVMDFYQEEYFSPEFTVC